MSEWKSIARSREADLQLHLMAAWRGQSGRWIGERDELGKTVESVKVDYAQVDSLGQSRGITTTVLVHKCLYKSLQVDIKLFRYLISYLGLIC